MRILRLPFLSLCSLLSVRSLLVLLATAALAACGADEERTNTDFGFEGTCVNCHAGLSAGHVHPNYKLRCVDCHGGDDQVTVPANAARDEAVFRNQDLLRQAHVLPKPGLARFFFANGVDDDNDGKIDEPATFNATKTQVTDFGEVFEPGLHGQGAGEFIDTELQRDLNYARFLNPGDLRVATISCGGSSRVALEGGGGGGCHQQTIDIVRRSVMVNQSAVINGAYYGNESWRGSWRAAQGNVADPRFGAFGYTLDYDGVDQCIDAAAAKADDPGGRIQPRFDSACLEKRAAAQDPRVAANAPGNAGLPAFEMAQGTLRPVTGVSAGMTIEHTGAGDSRLPWGGTRSTGDAHAELDPVPCAGLQGPDCNVVPGVPDPVDTILRTFRAYYPLNYPGSTNNFNFTFGTSIRPEIDRFKTQNPYGRGHSAGCSACHAAYNYAGTRAPTQVRQDDGTVVAVTDPTTKHRELDPARQDRGVLASQDRLIGRAVSAAEQAATGRPQQKTYSESHNLTAKVTTKTCGLCHGFVTRINYAYQGMAEEEQRDSLARRKPIEFRTPAGSQVRILDSWVREDNDVNNDGVRDAQPTVVVPDGVAVVTAARKRDADLAAQGFIAGAGGCVPEVFTEDCNNNGELDRELVLARRNEDGKAVAAIMINEDANGNGQLDLIDRLPREESFDGRQVRYVYGGRNGSTRQMDVHFERGMHCIDCHMLQDVHGDGHLYSTNWDAIEIECEDCHGALARTTLLTSGPNGGNDLRRGKNDDLKPFFEEKDGGILQRSRVTPGLAWKIPQTSEVQSPYAREAHDNRHLAPPGQGSTFAGAHGSSELTSAKLECSACHGSWIHNCMGCHVELNLGDKQRSFVDATGAITASAGENEVWLSNFNNPGHVNFQLLGLLRSPFVLGVSSTTEQGRLGPFRSSMQVHLTVSDAGGHTLIDNTTFTTFQAKDANSGRMNVATSGVAMNQTMPHTVRPAEARGCESCHPLVDGQGRVRNEHVLAQTYGLGTGAYPYVGDWAIAAGQGGIELFEHKQERELAANNTANASTRFPGMIVNPGGRTPAAVEPLFDGSGGIGATAVATDVALIRNFQPTPAGAMLLGPTLRDLAVLAVDAGGAGRLVISDITARGHPSATRPSVGAQAQSFILNLPAVPRGLAHLSPDTSDPFVYVAVGASGISVVRIADAPRVGFATATLVRTVSLQGGRTAQDAILAGDLLYVGTQQGTIDVLSLSNPELPMVVGSVMVGSAVNRLALAGFVLYAATSAGLVSVALDSPQNPGVLFPPIGPAATGLAIREGRAYLAAGAAGVIEIDVRTPAAPQLRGNISPQAVDARDIVVSQLPGQTWLLVLEGSGSLVGIKLDGKLSLRERCFPDPGAAQCLLDLQFMDPTQMSRDPSFDPKTGMFDPITVDPSAAPFFRQTRAIVTSGTRLARSAIWEQLGTLTGRRLRDSFMPGSGVLSLPVMRRMRDVLVCESTAPSNHPAGLGGLGYAGNGSCQPFSPLAVRKAVACRPASSGSMEKVCGPSIVAPAAAAAPAGRPPAPAPAPPPAPAGGRLVALPAGSRR